MQVKFYEQAEDSLLKFAVIVSKSCGMLYFADIKRFEKDLHSEMEKVRLFDGLPDALTYPQIQPLLIAEVQRREENHETDIIKHTKESRLLVTE